MRTTKEKLFIVLAVVIVIIGGLLIGSEILKKQSSDNNRNEPTNVRTWMDRGIDETNRTRLESRISELIGQIGGDRDVADLNKWIDLGNYRSILGDLAGARDAFRTATELNQYNYISWGNLGNVLAEMYDLGGAEDAYRKAIELQPIEDYYEKYAAFLQINFPDRKTDYENLLQEAIQKVGQLPTFVARLARFYEDEGRFEEAKSHLEVLRVLDPDNEGVREDLERVSRLIRPVP